VFNAGMLSSVRLVLTLGLTGAVLAVLAPAAGAEIIEVGRTDAATPPSCPTAPCLAVSRTTGYQAKVGVTRGLLTVPADGRIVAWTITLGRPGPKQTAFFNESLGGTSRAGITVLRPGKRLFARVAGESPVQRLEPWFGRAVMFPLPRSLPVRKGYVIGLTVPTWAPALAVGFGNDTSWRASRGRGSCQETGRQTAQMRLGQLSRYECLYRTARLTYSATLIPTPQPGSAEG
jgi:hypothetical protein